MRVGREEGDPSIRTHEEGPEQLKMSERGQGSGERLHGSRVEGATEVEPQGGEVGVQISEGCERRGEEVLQ